MQNILNHICDEIIANEDVAISHDVTNESHHIEL